MSYIVILMSFIAIFPSIGYGSQLVKTGGKFVVADQKNRGQKQSSKLF
jgi:hypothetical protein